MGKNHSANQIDMLIMGKPKIFYFVSHKQTNVDWKFQYVHWIFLKRGLLTNFSQPNNWRRQRRKYLEIIA